MAELVQNVIDTNGYAAQAGITVDIPAAISVVADINRIFVVTDSVISNAIRYSSPPRTIVIAYHTEETDPFHHISVSDNGIGIPAGSGTDLRTISACRCSAAVRGSSTGSGSRLPLPKKSWRSTAGISRSRACRVSGARLPCTSQKPLKKKDAAGRGMPAIPRAGDITFPQRTAG